MIRIDLVDVIIFFLLIGMMFRGAEVGFVRQLLTAIGFVGGVYLGALLAPVLVSHAANSNSKALWIIFIVVGVGIIFLSIGEFLGAVLKVRLRRFHLNKADNFLGSLLGAVTLLASVWLAASILIKLPFAGLTSEIQQSSIVGALNSSFPSAPNAVSKIGRLIDPNGFPQVFLGNEPTPSGSVTLPSAGAYQSIVNQDAQAVVKVQGEGCGGIVEGSGFVAAPDTVITDAHVIAGVAHPMVQVDGYHGAFSATPVWFDPNLDIAVLKVPGLESIKPIPMSTAVEPRGTQGIVMGYPGGGPLSAVPSAVMEQIEATGRNIYNQGNTDRQIYEIQADVIPGNSGGPMIDAQGNVIAVVFAQSTAYPHIGYALQMKQVNQEFQQAITQNQQTSTGTCAE